MARNLTPIVKLSRREGYALHPKAHKVMVRRTNTPGQHGPSRQQRPSQYAVQLREKQKVKRIYGLLEKQFRKLMSEAGKTKGKSGTVLLQLLERRLDNTLYRAGFTASRQAARQIVSHGHLEVNGKRVDIPSLRISPGDEIVVRAKSKKNNYFSNIEDLTAANENSNPSWLIADIKKLTIKITGLPTREEAEPDINEQLIVEYYSR